ESVQAVGQTKDDFTARVLKRVIACSWTERIREDVAPVGKQDVAVQEILRNGLKIVSPPVGSKHGIVSLKDAVVASDAGAVKACPRDPFLQNVQSDIDAQLTFPLGTVGRELKQVLVERRPGGGGEKPVGTDHGKPSQSVDHARTGNRAVEQDAVRILGKETVPQIRVPLIIAQIDAEDDTSRIDGARQRDAR